MNGAALKKAMGTPRSSFLHKSASVPPTSVMGAEKAIPSISRQTINVAMFCATAQGMIKMTATPKVTMYTDLRPKSSEQGAKARGPTPKPITNTVIVSKATSYETLKRSATPSRLAVMTEELKATTKQVKATTIVHHHFLTLVKFFGFSGSLMVKVTRSWSSTLPDIREMVLLGMMPDAVSSVNSCMSALSLSVPYGRSRMSEASCAGLVSWRSSVLRVCV